MAAFPVAASVQNERIKLRLVQGRAIVDCVYLNGQGPYRFLLDNGAQTNDLHIGVAAKMGLKAEFRTQLTTLSGAHWVPGGHLGQVKVGPAVANNQEFLFTSVAGPRELSGDTAGVLGQEFLSHFDYLLDFRYRRLDFAYTPNPDTGIKVRLLEGRMVMPTSLGDLVLDSGTDSLVLFRAPSGGSAQVLRTNAGSITVTDAGRTPLRVGGKQYWLASAVFAPAPSPGADGLLPARLFHAIYVSNSGGYVIPDPQK